MTAKQLLFPNVTEVDVDVFANAQLEFAILKQFGFYVMTQNPVDADFYKVALTLDPTKDSLVVNDPSKVTSSASIIFNALKTVRMGYLADLSAGDPSYNPDVIEEVNSWSAGSLLSAEASNVVQVQPNVTDEIGSMILNGIIGPMFTGRWGSSAIPKSNRDLLVTNTGTYTPPSSAVFDLGTKIAYGLANTLVTATNEAHEEVLQHLLDQIIDDPTALNDDGTDVTNQAQALDFLNLETDGNTQQVYASQDFWMKVYLDLNMNKTDAASEYIVLSPDYEHDMSAFDPTTGGLPVIKSDDDEGLSSSDNNVNLVAKTLLQAMTIADLNATFLSAFRGSIKIQAQDPNTYGTFISQSESTYDYSSGVASPVLTAGDDNIPIRTVRVPLLVKMSVGPKTSS